MASPLCDYQASAPRTAERVRVRVLASKQVTITMERRKFIIGVGAAAAGGTAALGTGAFSSVEADRSVSVEVGGDNDAYLGLEAERDDIISDDGGDGQLSLDLGSQMTAEGGEGFNDDAVTKIDGVFRITNQGTREVGAGFGTEFPIYQRNITPEIEAIDGVTLKTPEDEREDFDGGAEGVVLEPGESVLISVEVDTLDEDPEEADGSVVIGAYETGGL